MHLIVRHNRRCHSIFDPGWTCRFERRSKSRVLANVSHICLISMIIPPPVPWIDQHSRLMQAKCQRYLRHLVSWEISSVHTPRPNVNRSKRRKRAVTRARCMEYRTRFRQHRANLALKMSPRHRLLKIICKPRKSFRGKGLSFQELSFASIYKSQLLPAVDPTDSGYVTLGALTQQVVAGGGTTSQATALYKSMDEDGDGVVSDQEVEDSIPDPFATTAFTSFVANTMTTF